MLDFDISIKCKKVELIITDIEEFLKYESNARKAAFMFIYFTTDHIPKYIYSLRAISYVCREIYTEFNVVLSRRDYFSDLVVDQSTRWAHCLDQHGYDKFKYCERWKIDGSMFDDIAEKRCG